jgi:CheY-like chemotaxis protein
MTANLQNPVTSLKSISAELKAGMAAAEDAALSAALTSTVDDFDTALRSLETLMTTSLSFGKLVSEYKGQAEHVSCDVLHLMDHIRAASIAHDHIEWEVQEHSFRRSTHRPCTFPDAICFAMISALSELGPQWRRIRASVAYTEEDLDAVGRARRVEFVPSTETLGVLRRESQSTERVHGFIRFAIDVAESVTGAADESADYNSSSMRRDFTHIHHVLRAVNGAAQEQTHSSGRLFSYSVPCYLEPHHCENNGHNDAALMPFSILFADETFFNKTSLYEAFPPDAELHIATNGKAAAAVLQLQAFDVVFFEFLLPVMSGIELMEHHCAWLRSQQGRPTETTLFVGMTASANDEELRACFNSGMHVFCPKPVSARVVTEILSARRLSSTLEDAIAMIRSIDDVMLGD